MTRGRMLMLVFALSSAHAGAATPAAGSYDLMPAPERLEWQAGSLALDAGFTVAATGARDPRIDAARTRLLARLGKHTGLALRSAATAAARATLLLEATSAGLPVQVFSEDESYELTVTPQKARLIAPNPLGVLRGIETFLQLVKQDGKRYVVPAVKISDRPRFRWRGLLIDPCRRWQPVEVIQRSLDGMAAVKLNVLHWHLSEDQGFRIESKVYPKLHQEGSDGLFYTQEQVKQVIAYARERGIRVIPEFDMPGHSTSWLVAHPELGSAPGPFNLVRRWGIFDNDLDPSRDEVYTFLDRFLGEMAALFPDAYLHIGGDEVTPRQWNENASILDYMYRKDINDPGELQAHFNKRVNEILTRHGKRMVGWDEVLRPELPKSIVVQSWRGPKALAEAANLGYDGILSNGYYLDLCQPTHFHYLNDPIPPDSQLSEAARQHVLGGEACMWGEFVSPETIDSRVWPRAAAIAERLWSPGSVRDVDDMYRRMEIQSARLDAVGLSHRSGYDVMLRRIAGGQSPDALRVLADRVEPVKMYRRGAQRAYTSATPLDRLVDAARPESLAARTFVLGVDRFLLTAPEARNDKSLRDELVISRDNHASLEPVLATSALGSEALPLSRHLSVLGKLGLEALDALAAGRQASAEWLDRARRACDRAQRARAEVELAVVPGVRKLALAAGQLDALKGTSLVDWNRRLDEQVKQAEAPPPHE
jgi:hexosaminidase